MAGSSQFSLRSLRSLRRMPPPEVPRVRDYGALHVGEGHDLWLFPAIARRESIPQVDAILEEGQASCFFHPNLPATEVCQISGRLICDLCQTEWAGQTVSFEALQTKMSRAGKGQRAVGRTRWDNIALSMAILPLFVWVVTLVTAPLTLGLVLWRARKGPCSAVHRSGWRYLLAGVLALLQLGSWAFFILSGASF